MFVSRKKYLALELELHEARGRALSFIADTAVLNQVIRARDEELSSIAGFLKFLAATVPDYEGYILDYMDQEEFGNE